MNSGKFCILFASATLLSACDTASEFDRVPGNDVRPGPATSDISTGNRGVPAIAGFDLDIELSGDDIALSWEADGGTYEVWRATEPYFMPGDAGSTLLAQGLADPNYLDVGGNDNTTYYYRIVANAGFSTICGKYVQHVKPGYNKISQPLITGNNDAQSFMDSFAEDLFSVHKWEPTTQTYATLYEWSGFNVPSSGFNYDAGDCPIARPAWGVGHFYHKTVGYVPAYGEMDIPLSAGHNYVTAPLHMGDMMASELLATLPEGATVAAFTASGTGAPYTGGATGDFPISAGSCVSVSVTDAAVWPPVSDPLQELNDDFEDDNLDGWTQHNDGGATVTVDSGSVVIEPDPNTVWYNTDEGYHLCKPVNGNFAVTADMTVTNAAGGPTYPGDPLRIGGLMVRDPDSVVPNTYHVGLGVLVNPEMIFEFKSTESGVSTVGGIPWDDTHAELRVCRIGDMVHGMVRDDAGEWQIIDSRERPDLPDTLLAGPIAYADQATPDLQCSCDSVGFKSILSIEDCMTD